MSRYFFAVDTSNYTTSAAVFNADTRKVTHAKKLLPVKKGERGIRQSNAVFHHVQQLPEMVETVMNSLSGERTFLAAGASTQPRRVKDSYMPCFLVGTANAGNFSVLNGIPFYAFSHQEGHVAAALYSAGKLDWVGQEFLAFHVSGGTTESLFVHPGDHAPIEADLVGTSTDLKAGMAIDRVGVMLGLNFPAGPQMEKLAHQSKRHYKIHPPVKDLDCSLSGVENQCRKMLENGEKPEDIALYCIRYVEAALALMAKHLIQKYPGLPLIFSGGVMSNQIIRNDFTRRFNAVFAEPEFSADNAAGTAVLTALSYERGFEPADPAAICAARNS